MHTLCIITINNNLESFFPALLEYDYFAVSPFNYYDVMFIFHRWMPNRIMRMFKF